MYAATMMIPSYHCIAIVGLRIFFALLVVTLVISPHHTPTKLFLSPNGRSHRLVGAANLTWLIVGVVMTCNFHQPKNDSSDVATFDNSIGWSGTCILLYDIILGILGSTATFTAAREFPHKRVINRPGESGTLSHVAMVTQSEMIEHSFYQMLNLWQALYLHTITWAVGIHVLRSTVIGRMVLLWIVTLPWSLRRFFPVNSFSANWTNHKQQYTTIDDKNEYVQTGTTSNNMNEKGISSTINIIYRIKKWQYVFYKHVILHGLNISMAFPKPKLEVYENDVFAMPLTNEWRVFWLCLNTST